MFNSVSQTQRALNQSHTRGDLVLFTRAYMKGKKAHRRAVLRRKRNHLLSLEEITKGRGMASQTYSGLKTVPIDQIQGSEERSGDFDRFFNPIKKYNMHRWMGIASVRLQGRALPAVDLLQIGDIYIVKDGHHRISVARALGEEFIDANVILWKLR